MKVYRLDSLIVCMKMILSNKSKIQEMKQMLCDMKGEIKKGGVLYTYEDV